jgi:hypothetical protein
MMVMETRLEVEVVGLVAEWRAMVALLGAR